MSAADTTVFSWLTRVVGQVFLARDTLLESVTVWRAAVPDSDALPRHLFLIGVDRLGQPDAQRVILDGPTVVNLVGDGVHPVPYVFSFDPPITLPRPGRYCLVITQNGCEAAEWLVASDHDPYPDGAAWQIGTEYACTSPSGVPRSLPAGIDLIFNLELCQAPTPSGIKRGGD